MGKTPLHVACMRNNVHMFKLLMSYYPDVNKKDSQGNTALTYTIENDNQIIASVSFFLIKKRHCLSIKPSLGLMAMEFIQRDL